MRFLPPVKTPIGEARFPLAERTALYLILWLCRLQRRVSAHEDLLPLVWGDPCFATWAVNNFSRATGQLPSSLGELLEWLGHHLSTLLWWPGGDGFDPEPKAAGFERNLAQLLAEWFVRVFCGRTSVPQSGTIPDGRQSPQETTAPELDVPSGDSGRAGSGSGGGYCPTSGRGPGVISWPVFLSELISLGSIWATLEREVLPLPIGQTQTMERTYCPSILHCWGKNPDRHAGTPEILANLAATPEETFYPALSRSSEGLFPGARVSSGDTAGGSPEFLWDVELGICAGGEIIRQIVDALPHLAGKLRRLSELEDRFAEKLEAANLEALAEFSAGAAHELNNPLAIISGRAQLLLRSETSPDRRMALATIIAQTRRAHEMLADLRLFARPPRPEFRSVDLAELIRNLVEEFGKEIEGTGIRLQSQIGEAPIFCQVDPVQIRVALEALCRNAAEALGESGQISIDLRFDEKEVLIEVRDNGPGIPPQYQPLVFHPFFSGRNAGRGLGFGLSKAWRIIQLHGGRLELHSVPGSGTLAVVWLPRSTVSTPTAATSPHSSPAEIEPHQP